MTSFDKLGLTESVLQGVRSAGYDTPTPIQAAAIPVARRGHDLIGCAQTGTGKTAAFVLPMLDRMVHRHAGDRRRAVRSLTIVPTRELALQVETAVRTYGRHTSLRSLAVFGGVGIHPQMHKLRRGIDMLVATPGRLLDLMDRGTVDLSSVEVLILDEADRMLDMGFIRDIRKIVAAIPRERQTMLFSATMPREVRTLANRILQEPEYLEMGERRNPAATVAQHVCAVKQAQKTALLAHILDNEPVENVIVFARTKHRADRVARQLKRSGFSTTVLHSNRSQSQRERALDGFRTGRFRVLVATNIAARGIDVDSITHVINYDTPRQAEDYIHRIGRTGRAAATGDAITFVGEEELPYLRAIERHTGKRLERLEYDGLTLDGLDSLPASTGRSGSDAKRRSAKSRHGYAPRGHTRNGPARRRKYGSSSKGNRKKYV